MATTLSDVASQAGVDKSTVSLVLGRSKAGERISQATRERIIAAAKDLGYRPNVLARGLRSGRTYSLGVLWSLSVPVVSAAMVRSLGTMAHCNKCISYVLDSLGSVDAIAEALEEFASRRVDGVVVELWFAIKDQPKIASLLSEFKSVVVVSPIPQGTALDHVVHDRCSAIEEVADHFAKTGRNKPGMLLVNDGQDETQSMKATKFVSRLRSHGISVPESNIVGVQRHEDGFRDCQWHWAELTEGTLDSVFGRGKLPCDSLLCGGDDMAMSAVSWLESRGQRVPEDVAVVGFNNYDFSKYYRPALASVKRNDQAVVTAVEKMLFGRVAENDRPSQHETVTMEFVCRESAG